MIILRNVLVQIGLSQSAKQFLHSRNCTTTSVKITEKDVHEPALFIEATLQHEAVKVGIEFQKLPRCWQARTMPVLIGLFAALV